MIFSNFENREQRDDSGIFPHAVNQHSIGQSQKQSSVTSNFPNEKSPLQYSLSSKFFNHFFIFLKQDNVFLATVCKTVRPVLSYHCAVSPVCLSCMYNVGVLWPNGWMDQDATWYGGSPYQVLNGLGQQPPTFWPMPFVAKWFDGSRCHLVWRWASARQDCVRWRPSSPNRKGHSSRPTFWCMSKLIVQGSWLVHHS